MKKLVAYINWQQYGFSGGNYSLPKTLCSTFWLTLIGIITLPLTIFGNIWNEILYRINPMDRYDNYQNDLKLNFIVSAIFHFIIFMAGIAGDGMFFESETNPFGWIIADNFVNGGFFVEYLKVISLGLGMLVLVAIAMGIIFFILAGFVAGGGFLLDKAKDSINDAVYDAKHNPKEAKESIWIKLTRLWLAIKGKFCPTMDWNDVINE